METKMRRFYLEKKKVEEKEEMFHFLDRAVIWLVLCCFWWTGKEFKFDYKSDGEIGRFR